MGEKRITTAKTERVRKKTHCRKSLLEKNEITGSTNALEMTASPSTQSSVALLSSTSSSARPLSRHRRRKSDVDAMVPNGSDTSLSVPAGRNFTTCYMELCKKHRLRPLPVICVTLPYSLDFITDRVKMDDWGPILNSLSLDRSLRSVSVRSRYQYRKPSETTSSLSPEIAKVRNGKAPAGMLTRYLLEWLSQSVGQCVGNSVTLTRLELEGIPFPPDCLAVLCVGLAGTESLKHLSLQRCYIGDAGCELVCRAITNVRTIESLNLSDCDLTSRCGSTLARTLSSQKLSLYHDTWKQSLRYRQPNVEAMPGLRRLTLSDNPHLGDSVVIEIIEAIRDSLWLKAIDLQRCGLTDRIGNDLLDLLDHNRTLSIFDIRQNPNINDELVKEVLRKFEEKKNTEKCEYEWLDDRKDRGKGDNRKLKKKDKEEERKRQQQQQQLCEEKSVASLTTATAKRSQATSFASSRDTKRSKKEDSLHEKNATSNKTSLHLDLQARIQPPLKKSEIMVSPVEESAREVQRQEDDEEEEEDDDEDEEEEEEEENEEEEEEEEEEKKKQKKKKKILTEDLVRELQMVKETHDFLLEESKRNDLMLAREKAKREMAESKLRSMSVNLANIESYLREKEKESDGYLLVSQQSLDTIYASFNTLLETLESLRRNSVVNRSEAEAKYRARIEFIRKTKSENLARGYVVDVANGESDEINVEEVESSRYMANNAKNFAKSESDVRKRRDVSPVLSPVQLERNIGDSPNVLSPTWKDYGTFRRYDYGGEGDKPTAMLATMSPAERAREIFMRIVNGDSNTNFSCA